MSFDNMDLHSYEYDTEIYVYKAVVRVVCPKGWVSGVYVVNDFAGRWQYKRIERRDHPVSLHMF